MDISHLVAQRFTNSTRHIPLRKVTKSSNLVPKEEGMPSILNNLLFLFTFFLSFEWKCSLASSSSSSISKYKMCEPKTCGNGPNITYPFYIEGKQPHYCGFPRFSLECDHNGFPTLNQSQTLYTIHEIFYNNHTFRASNPQFSNTTLRCLSPTMNITFSTVADRFHFAPDQTELLLFFNCHLPSLPPELQRYRIGCSAENRTNSVVAVEKNNPNTKYARRYCKGNVTKVWVGEEYRKEGIGEALRKGFVVGWREDTCEGCKKSGGKCGYDSDAYSFRCYCRDGDHSLICDSEKTGKSVVVIATTVAGVGAGALIIVIYCFRRQLFSLKITRFWKNKSKAHQDFEAFLKSHGPLPIKRYSYAEIKKMTDSFNEKLGQGGYGSVFKGTLHDKRLVAVKVLNETKGNGEEFINEVASISRTSHVNIVTLLGFCFEGSKKALVYEFMANGSLEKFIYENQNDPSNNVINHQLSCDILYQIAVGVARGLEYLHRGCNTRILHFDIKPHNILLDEKFFPKISDFGLAKICPRNESFVSMLCARGTIGYIAPEVISRNFGGVSHKSDVYSFGMMVLEMVGGRRNVNVEVDCTSEIYFPHWIYKRLELNQELALESIRDEGDKERMRQMVMVSLWCIQTNPSERPKMSKVVEMLEGRVESLPLPPKPYLSSPLRSQCSSSTQ